MTLTAGVVPPLSALRPTMSYMTAMALSYLFEAAMPFSRTLSMNFFGSSYPIIETKRCMKTPSMPYCFIHLKCVSTVWLSIEE